MKFNISSLPRETVKEGSRITFLYLARIAKKKDARVEPSYHMIDWYMILFGVLSFFLLLSVIGIIFILRKDILSCFFSLSLFLFVAFCFIRWCYLKWCFRRDTESILSEKTTVTVDQEAIHVKRDSHSYSIPWNSVRYIAMNPHSILFLPYSFGEPCLLIPVEYKIEVDKMIREFEKDSLVVDYTKK